MAKTSFKLHPVAVLYMLKAYWYILTAPFVRMIIQYLFLKEVVWLLLSERVLLLVLMIIVVLKWLRTDITVTTAKIVIKRGVFVRLCETIEFSQILSVVTEQNAFDVVLGASDCYIDVESEVLAKRTKIKINSHDAKKLCNIIYGGILCEELNIKRKKSRYFTVPLIIFAATVIGITKFDVFWQKGAYGLSVAFILIAVELYYIVICYYNYRQGKLYFGSVVYAQGIKVLKIYKLYCNNNKLDIIDVTQSPIDKYHRTCKMRFRLCERSGKALKIKNIDLKDAKEKLKMNFN